MTRRGQSWYEREKPKVEVEVDQDEDPTAGAETNTHTADQPGDGPEASAETETDTTAAGGAPDPLTAGKDIPVRDTPAPDQDPGGEIERRKLKIDTTE